MAPFRPEDRNKAAKDASSYEEFRENLKELGYKIPTKISRFPMNMKGWGRKLRYEVSQDYNYGKHPTGHDLRQAEYYNRLERMGHPDPLMVFNR